MYAVMAAKVTGLDTEYIEWEMPVAKVNHYIAIFWAMQPKPKECHHLAVSTENLLNKALGIT